MRRHASITFVTFAVALLPMDRSLQAQTPEAGMKVYAAQKCSMSHSIGGQGNKKLPLDGVART